MNRSHPPRPALGFLLGLLALSACNCDEGGLVPIRPGTCEPTYACPAGFDYRLGDCRVSRCQVDTDCCPGQKCNAAAGFCADQFVECEGDDDCAELPGQACIDFRGARSCGYPNRGNALTAQGTQACATAADCDPGRTCFGERCVTAAPCEGGCPDGEVCDVDTNLCFALPSCTESCGPGQMRVVADPDTMSGPSCCLVECKCETLPPVAAGESGWWSAIAANEQGIAVSAYDSTYGDLVVLHFDRDGALLRTDHVDGFPASGPLVGNPGGPRGGRTEPGDDVGQHTSIAVDAAGVLHVAYHDATSGTLKYAHSSGSGWTTSVVDDDGRVGLYTSLAIGPDGAPRIAYMMAEGAVAGEPVPHAGLKLATARSSLPQSSADWTIELVDSRPRPAPVCGGGCARGEACVDLGAGPACAPEQGGCGPCGMGEACVDRAGTPTCVSVTPTVVFDGLPEGTGLFASLALEGDRPAIAYHDSVAGDLRLARRNASGGFDLVTLDGDDPAEPSNVGQHASLAVRPGGGLAVAYFDATRDDLVFLEVESGLREVVDDGVSPPDLRFVGADASLGFDPAGNPAIAYQDPTMIDLVHARRLGSPAMWSTEVLLGGAPDATSEGTPAGFYASQAVVGGRALVSSVSTDFDAEGRLQLEVEVLAIPLE